jgi:hypothetical protein
MDSETMHSGDISRGCNALPRVRPAVLMACLFASALVVSSSQVSADPGSAGSAVKVRTDGVYCLVLKSDVSSSGSPRCVAIRFYRDGTSVEGDYRGRPADCAKWLKIENESLYPGRWTLTGTELKTAVSKGFEESTRTGTLTADGWVVSPLVTFKFIPMTFAPTPTAGAKNHRPYFKGAGNAVRKLDYDAAGNMAGVDDELEVQAEDPDGDKLTFTWMASNGTVVGEGNRITWKRLMGAGRPVPGVIKIEVSDGRGGKVSSQIAQ